MRARLAVDLIIDDIARAVLVAVEGRCLLLLLPARLLFVVEGRCGILVACITRASAVACAEEAASLAVPAAHMAVSRRSFRDSSIGLSGR